ncbi:hypothetical protein F2Q70_00041528 [Brassica cretica]|nr:hypothetical protein F2Q70_00041528 [Brassica cretica]
MAPFFVLLEVLQSVFGYEPYPGFQARVNAKVESDIKEWRAKKQLQTLELDTREKGFEMHLPKPDNQPKEILFSSLSVVKERRRIGKALASVQAKS